MGLPALAGSNGKPATAQLLPFAYGTSRKPVPIGQIPYTPGTTYTLRVPKSGFLSRLRFAFSGTYKNTVAGTAAVIPLWNLISNYSLANSIGYNYRNHDGDTLAFRNRIYQASAGDPVTGSPSWSGLDNTSTANQTATFNLKDEVSFNDGINFDKFLLSAQTLDNDLIVSITWNAATILAVGGATGQSITNGNLSVTAEYYTVPDVSKFAMPDTGTVMQVVDDKTYTSVVAGVNTVHLLPIQGPEFLGIGLKLVVNSVEDAVNAASNILRVQVMVNGTDPIMDFSGQDLVAAFFERFARAPQAGYLYLNFADDISLPNAMGPVERLAFSTQAYSQIDLVITLASSLVVAGTSYIKLVKIMQSEVAA